MTATTVLREYLNRRWQRGAASALSTGPLHELDLLHERMAQRNVGTYFAEVRAELDAAVESHDICTIGIRGYVILPRRGGVVRTTRRVMLTGPATITREGGEWRVIDFTRDGRSVRESTLLEPVPARTLAGLTVALRAVEAEAVTNILYEVRNDRSDAVVASLFHYDHFSRRTPIRMSRRLPSDPSWTVQPGHSAIHGVQVNRRLLVWFRSLRIGIGFDHSEGQTWFRWAFSLPLEMYAGTGNV